jgi:hypothetical protein
VFLCLDENSPTPQIIDFLVKLFPQKDLLNHSPEEVHKMEWRFWKKNALPRDLNNSTLEKLSKPKDIPVQIGMHLVVNMKKSPDWVWSLRAVERTKTTNETVAEFRIFDPAQTVAAKVGVKDYYSLSEHPELILFEGWLDRKKKGLEVKENKTAALDDARAA